MSTITLKLYSPEDVAGILADMAAGKDLDLDAELENVTAHDTIHTLPKRGVAEEAKVFYGNHADAGWESTEELNAEEGRDLV